MQKFIRSHFRKLAVLGAVILAFSLEGSAQVYVHIRPSAPPPMARPVRPSPGHVWVEDEWVPREGRYEVVRGHWEAPPRRGVVYVRGHWARHRRDYVWVPGHWSR